MARVVLADSAMVNVIAFDTYAEAQALACEVFTCAIAAIGRTANGTPYFRPAESKDETIFAYAVLTLQI